MWESSSYEVQLEVCRDSPKVLHWSVLTWISSTHNERLSWLSEFMNSFFKQLDYCAWEVDS